MACFLPFRPLGISDLRVFGSKESCLRANLSSFPLRHFSATSASLPLLRRLPTNGLRRPYPTLRKHLAEAFGPYSVCGSKSPFLRSPYRRSEKKVLPHSLPVSPPGFGYPLGDLQLSQPRKPLSAPNALGLRPSKLFSSQVIEEGFPSPLRSCASLQNLSGLVPTLQRFPPTRKAVPLLAPQCFTSGRGLLLSWAFQPLRLSLR